jgi:hypothetical protein
MVMNRVGKRNRQMLASSFTKDVLAIHMGIAPQIVGSCVRDERNQAFLITFMLSICISFSRYLFG